MNKWINKWDSWGSAGEELKRTSSEHLHVQHSRSLGIPDIGKERVQAEEREWDAKKKMPARGKKGEQERIRGNGGHQHSGDLTVWGVQECQILISWTWDSLRGGVFPLGILRLLEVSGVFLETGAHCLASPSC